VPNGALRLAFVPSAFIAVRAANDEPEIVKALGYDQAEIFSHDGCAILLRIPSGKDEGRLVYFKLCVLCRLR
jgi:hypothetical protein